jgi:hypothetical protein
MGKVILVGELKSSFEPDKKRQNGSPENLYRPENPRRLAA